MKSFASFRIFCSCFKETFLAADNFREIEPLLRIFGYFIYRICRYNRINMAANCAMARCDWLKNFWNETKNPERLPAKLHYFLYFASVGGIVPLLPLLALQLEASPYVIGYIYMSVQIVTVLFKYGFGFIADKFRRRKPLFLICLIISTSAFVSIYFIPVFIPETHCRNKNLFLRACIEMSPDALPGITCNATCLSSESNPKFDDLCATHHFTPCSSRKLAGGFSEATLSGARLKLLESSEEECSSGLFDTIKDFKGIHPERPCVTTTLNSCKVTCGDEAGVVEDYKLVSWRVAWLWILMVIGNMFGGCVVSLGDAIVLGMIKDPEIYEKQRAFGSFSYPMAVIVSMVLVRVFGVSERELSFSPAACFTLLFGVFSLVVAMRLKENVEDNEEEEKQKPTCTSCGSLLRLFLSWETGLHSLAVLCVGFLTGAMGAFFVINLKQLHATQMLLGFVVAVQSLLGEIPFAFISSYIINKVGHGYLMTVALGVFGMRLLCISLIQAPWNVLIFEPYLGVCLGLFLACMNTFSLKISPPGSRAAVQGIFRGIFEGAGIGIGAFVAGYLYDAYGSRSMWQILGITGVILAFFHGLGLFWIRMLFQELAIAPAPQEAAAGDEDVVQIIEMAGSIVSTPVACSSKQ